MSKEQPRRPAGTPAGGQWAPMAHAEPEVDLGGGLRRLVRESGTVEWRLGTKLHRDDGPAVEHSDGTYEWWVNGEPVSVPPTLGAIASGPDVLSRVGDLPSPAKAQLERDVVLTKASKLSAEDVELYERGERLPMASVLEVARGTTETVEVFEIKLNETLRRLEP